MLLFMTIVNSKLPLLRPGFPPPHQRHVSDYAKVNFNRINKAIGQFNWQGSFTNLPINEQVNLFNSTSTFQLSS